MELLEKLGIDWRLLIAQIINFGVLLAVLYKFLYKPVLGILRKRQEKIEKSLEQAKKIEEESQAISKMKEEKIIEARTASQKIIEKAEQTAEQRQEEMIMAAQKQSQEITTKAKEKAKETEAKIYKEAKNKLADLVVTATSQVIKKSLKEKEQKELISDTISEIIKD